MIQTLDNLRQAVNSKIKVIQNNNPEKTQAADVKQLLTDILDTLNDLVEKQGLSISSNISSSIKQVTDSLANYAKTSQLPDLSVYQKVSDSISYSRILGAPTYDLSPYQLISNAFNGNYSTLVGKPDFSIYATKDQLPNLTNYALKTDIPAGQDLSAYQLKTDNIAYSRLIGVPSVDYSNIVNKPILLTSYNQLTDKPNIPTYDLSLYRKTSDAIDYITLINKPTIVTSYTQLTNTPTIITDYTQLNNKPSMSKLMWNQIGIATVSNSVVETNVLINGSGVLTIDANPTVGTTYRVSGRGMFSLQTLTSPTLNIRLYVGNTLIASGSSNSLLLGASNKTFSFGIDLKISSPNSVYAQGFFAYYAGLTDALSSTPLINGSGVDSTVDLTVSNTVKLTFTWSIANTANVIQTKIVNFEKLNN